MPDPAPVTSAIFRLSFMTASLLVEPFGQFDVHDAQAICHNRSQHEWSAHQDDRPARHQHVVVSTVADKACDQSRHERGNDEGRDHEEPVVHEPHRDIEDYHSNGWNRQAPFIEGLFFRRDDDDQCGEQREPQQSAGNPAYAGTGCGVRLARSGHVATSWRVDQSPAFSAARPLDASAFPLLRGSLHLTGAAGIHCPIPAPPANSRSPAMSTTCPITAKLRRHAWLVVVLLTIGARAAAVAQPPTDRTKPLHTLTG